MIFSDLGFRQVMTTQRQAVIFGHLIHWVSFAVAKVAERRIEAAASSS